MEGLQSVQAELAAKRADIAAQLEAARTQAASLESDLARIDAALNALSRKPPSGTKRKRAPQSKPSASKDEIRSYILEAKKTNPQLSGDKLKTQVKARVKEAGRALTGFGILYPKALQATN